MRVDEAFAGARASCARSTGSVRSTPPASFHGELRDYQREALGWLAFLRRFGFGGCLADDMGLGKTVQVLALLERAPRVAARKGPAPSLVVVPRSLVFNWIAGGGAVRPQLRVLDYTGDARRAPRRVRRLRPGADHLRHAAHAIRRAARRSRSTT